MIDHATTLHACMFNHTLRVIYTVGMYVAGDVIASVLPFM